jgi:hypothetical protein
MGAIRSGADNSGRFIFQTNNAGTITERMTILPDGKVGIGTASPASLLEVSQALDGTTLRISSQQGGSSHSTTVPYGSLEFYSADGSGGGAGNRGSIKILPTTTTGAGGRMILSVASNTELDLERMRIDENGNVGIGTPTPNQLFEVKGAGLVYAKISSGTNSSFRGLAFGIENDATVYGNVSMEVNAGELRHSSGFSGWGGFQTFLTNGTEKMRILANGNVGIGTTNPLARLHVVGDVYLVGSTLTDVIRPYSTDRLTIGQGGANVAYFNSFVGINENAPTAQLQVKSGATNRVGLAITTTATTGHTANIAEFSANNSLRVLVGANGLIRTTNGLANMNSANNSNIAIGTLGTNISRDVADTNPALIVNLLNASSTGHIQVWQSQTDAKAHITRTGIFVGQTRPTRTDITANATLALADEGKVLRVNSSSNLTVTIPLNSSVAFPIDTEIAILRYGTGTVSISPTSGVTLNSVSSNRKVKDQYGSVALKKIGENEWVLVGSLEA